MSEDRRDEQPPQPQQPPPEDPERAVMAVVEALESAANEAHDQLNNMANEFCMRRLDALNALGRAEQASDPDALAEATARYKETGAAMNMLFDALGAVYSVKDLRRDIRRRKRQRERVSSV